MIWLIFFKSTVSNDYMLNLENDRPYSDVRARLIDDNVLTSTLVFDLVSFLYSFDTIPKGCYKIKSSMTSFELVRKLKNGSQDPLRWTISTATFIEEIAGSAGQKFNFDSTRFLNTIMSTSFMDSLSYTKETALTLFLPNTYEFYCSATPEAVLKKMYREKLKFWTEERLTKASKLGLTPDQVYILASLVQKEYTRKDERSRISSVLLNRLKIDMPLQVDATCKYATLDFGAKRVGSYHILFNSPYNTYKVKGLPPGPICMPELSTIDAVLNSESSDYLYYCADPSLNGYHIFSRTFEEHTAVAASYHSKMNDLKIH